MTENYLISLIARNLSGELNEAEVEELNQWSTVHSDNKLFLDSITDEELLEKELNLWLSFKSAQGYAKWKSLHGHRKAIVRRIVGWSVAACLLVAIAIIGLSRKIDNQSVMVPTVAKAKADQPLLPGRNTARLTLSSGQQILLDSAENGDLAFQGNAHIKHYSGGLAYTVSGKSSPGTVLYNTLTTPRSGQYQLTLPDGSQVWLNNVSSLKYPTSFQGEKRIVELTAGEAYFEIAKDPSKPFIVKVRNEEIEVLGTSFNVMSYLEEDATQTTLLNGAIRVKTSRASTLLKPDEQAQLDENGSLKVIKDVPSKDIVSWKDGFFYFDRASFVAVMRQLARWYNVDVIYEGKVPDMEFGGKIDRNLPLQELLNFLDKNQVHFRIEGHNLIVLPS